MTGSLTDQTIVVTGAGRGLGAALAVSLADLGGDLVLCGRSMAALALVAGQIETRTGRPARAVALDLADAACVEAAAKEITRLAPVVDVVIHNGATWLEQRSAPFAPGEVLGAVNSAITGAYLLTQALSPALASSRRPDVVTIGSISAMPNAGRHDASVPFYAAKHGQAALADGLRQLFWGTPVRSICVHPPWLEGVSPLDPEWERTALRAKGEMATYRDVVEAVVFAITRPRHVTLASIVIDSDARGTDSRGHDDA
jgi:NADP-dependent 3-hydroxy acid dehydrogenase YdfG